MRHSLFARLLLIFTLLFVQTGGMMHEISHTVANQSHSDHTLSHEKHCDLCAAYAQLGSGLGNHGIVFNSTEQRIVLTDASINSLCTSPAFAAFAARAPPCSA
jgi:hypothetical protein